MQPPPAPSDPNAGKVPTWGYGINDGVATLLHLDPGEALPEGYVDSPEKCITEATTAPKPKARKVASDDDGA